GDRLGGRAQGIGAGGGADAGPAAGLARGAVPRTRGSVQDRAARQAGGGARGGRDRDPHHARYRRYRRAARRVRVARRGTPRRMRRFVEAGWLGPRQDLLVGARTQESFLTTLFFALVSVLVF